MFGQFAETFTAPRGKKGTSIETSDIIMYTTFNNFHIMPG